MNLKVTFLNSVLVSSMNGGVGVTFVDHNDHRAANEPDNRKDESVDWNQLSLESKTLFETWS